MSSRGSRTPGVSAVIVGSEILTGKITDTNGPRLIQRLKANGTRLHWMVTVHDEPAAIEEAVRQALEKASHVLTSGGIGPTHDDVTVRSVARALDRPVVRMPELVQLIERHYREVVTPEALRLADAPEGTVLLSQSGSWYPVLLCERVFMLPGVPQLFERQLETILPRLPRAPLHGRTLYVRVGEVAIAAVLDRLVASMPSVAIGSYPDFIATDYRVKLTVESESPRDLEAALERLHRDLPAGVVVREE